MCRRTSIAVAVCLCVVALGGQLSAGTIIDENFDQNPLIGHTGPRVPVNMDRMGMWLFNMDAHMGMWRYVDDNVGHVMGMGMPVGMNTTMWPWYNTLVYFVGMPREGWGGDGLELSFDYLYFPADPSMSMGSMAMFGVYGWEGSDKIVDLESASPGQGGMELMAEALEPSFDLNHVIQLAGGVLPASAANGWDSAAGTYLGPLGGFDFIGVTFTIGASEPSGDALELRLDNVRLDVIPEPTSMVLVTVGMAMATYIRRRRKHRHR